MIIPNNSPMLNKPKQKRNKFTIHDEESMQDYASKIFGNPRLLSFWESAKQRGLFSTHTSESLRFHWKLMMERNKISNPRIKIISFAHDNMQIDIKNNPPLIFTNPQRQIDQKNIQEIQNNKENPNDVKNNENIETEISDDTDNQNFEDFDNFESKKNVEINQKKSMKKHGEGVNQLEIDQIFENLCDICGMAAGRRLECNEVLRTLLDFNGDVKKTIEFYKRCV
ncbi:hypothetical protein SteCoe_34884 [Stentor coeruleus]|uniref:Uncharacterized protein n=1 Tax=Stentor coeruleus TaxID=5963 RepID=A0A1R2ATJ7_9CILI|nr:hypothetical protein SteCoe_34884 [Stentor coeruleus]